MKDIGYRLYLIIDRHRVVFSISLTIFMVGFFSGIFHTVSLRTAQSTEFTAEIAARESILGMLTGFALPCFLAIILMYIAGYYKLSTLIAVPIIIGYRGYTASAIVINALNGVEGFFECVLAALPLACINSFVFIFGGMIALSNPFLNKGDMESYKSFYIFLFIIMGIAVIYYCVVKYVLSMIFPGI
ncbi:MAG TPA: hypothetical protein PLZ84_03950 [Clostridia bacterium]|nr:hypothetical protein [Clostridia bacterium]